MTIDRRSIADGLVPVALTVLVWGLYPFSRGVRFAGDDINFLYVAWLRLNEPIAKQLLAQYPPDGWTRALAFWPFVLATHVSSPVVFLQSFYGAVWLLNGLAIAYLASVLWPASRLAPLIGGCLMVTATSDSLTGSVVYAPHMLGVALFFLGTAHLLRSAERADGWGRAVVATLLLTWSFFTVEYTYPVVPLLPLLIWVHAHPGWTPRFRRSLWALALSFVPAAVMVAIHVLRPGSHAAAVLAPSCALPPHCSPREWLALLARHTWHNVWPPAWAFRAIPPWYDNYATVFPPLLGAVAAALGVSLALWRFRHYCRGAGEDSTPPPRRLAAIIAWAFVAMVVVNTATVNLGLDYFVRSHFVSRGWASVGLAMLLASVAHIRRWKIAAGVVFAVFVFFGIWGGVERQGYLLGYAIHERRELTSLLEAVPGLAPPTRLVVIQPPGSASIIASSNPNTIPFLYGDASLWPNIITAITSPFESSRIEGDDMGRIRVVSNSKQEAWVDPASCIMVFYSISQGRFIRLDRVPAGLLRGSDTFFETYRPERLVLPGGRRTPSAVRDFLSHADSESPPMTKQRWSEVPNLVTVVAPLANRVQVDSLTPFVLERQPAGYVVWLGSGRAEGYSSLLWAREPIATTLSIEIAPGPGGRSPQRHLVARLTQADGEDRSLTRQFDARTTVKLPLSLETGANILEVWLDDVADAVPAMASEKRNLLGYVEGMRLGPK